MNKKNTLLFDDLLEKIDKKLPFLLMNPRNEASERKKFLSKKNYIPVFRYNKPNAGIDKLFISIDKLELKDSIINQLFQQKLEKFKNTNAMVQSLGKDDFSFFSKEIFGVPDKVLVKKAYKILEKKPSEEEKNIPSKQMCKIMRKVLEEFGLKNWVVRTKKMSANAAVLASKRRVYVRKNSMFSSNFMKGVIVHEIGTHVFRSANGVKQPYKMFRTGLPNYLMTEEGLAVNAEEMNGCLKVNTLRIYAGRVIAVHLASQAGFRQVFNELRKYFKNNIAWRITLRAKRGLRDTSKPGGYTKDHLYLKGYYEVKKFLEQKGNRGLKTLYYGKIGLEHVPLMKKIKGLKEPELTPVSKEFKKIIRNISA